MAYFREATIEKHLVAEVKKAGGTAYKFLSPGRRAVPDRLVLLEVSKSAGSQKGRRLPPLRSV